MGTINSANDEWIELKNTTNQDVELSGWSIKSSSGKIKIQLEGKILANSFYLLERTDDTSLLEIKADLTYKGALNNTGMDLGLYNNSGLIIDSLDYLSGWPAGDNTTKQTAERSLADLWQTSKDYGGTPKLENSSGATKIEKKKDLKEEKALTESKKTDNKKSVATAAIIENKNSKDNTPLSIFSVSALLVLFSAGIILFIKFKK